MILVTGGLGFIGSHIALSFMAHGQEVIIVDNLSNSNLHVLERLEQISGMYIPFVKLDIRNTPALNKVFEQYSIDAVIHTANFKSLEESVLKPLEYYNDNVSCIMSLLRTMQRTGVRTLVHLSSLMVYGQSSLDLKEDLTLNYSYANPYIKSQQMIEDIIQDTARTDDEWRIAILRMGNIAGAFENAMLGEFCPPLPKNIVPLLMQVAAQQRDHFELRKDAKTSDHTAERSFLHILDACDAIAAALHWLGTQSFACETFNIAGEIVSMQQLIAKMEQVSQSKISLLDQLDATWPELDQVGAKCEKAKDVLYWEAKRSLDQTLQDAWRFYQRNLEQY